MRFINGLSKSDKIELRNNYKKSNDPKVRNRCHCILLSNKKFTINQLCLIFDKDRDTISSWLNRWEEYGLEGLFDGPRSGRPPLLFDDIKKKFLT